MPRSKRPWKTFPLTGKSTPFSLVKQFDYVTLDTKWATLYNELDSFESITNKIVNIHLHGSLRESKWVLNSSNLGFYEALDLIRDRWKYSGLLTVEPEGKRDKSLFNNFVKAMRSLRTQLRANSAGIYFISWRTWDPNHARKSATKIFFANLTLPSVNEVSKLPPRHTVT